MLDLACKTYISAFVNSTSEEDGLKHIWSVLRQDLLPLGSMVVTGCMEVYAHLLLVSERRFQRLGPWVVHFVQLQRPGTGFPLVMTRTRWLVALTRYTLQRNGRAVLQIHLEPGMFRRYVVALKKLTEQVEFIPLPWSFIYNTVNPVLYICSLVVSE